MLWVTSKQYLTVKDRRKTMKAAKNDNAFFST